ncbi:Protein of unknown function [Bacillus thuringiensis]|uniref:Uncharacterized protein n=1 Tax=Bacillus thuringiensis TaxID=1428 RepID=A0A1C4E149_BACTU|nr:Protein of unknown function [Bacillus thuringiensis]
MEVNCLSVDIDENFGAS